MLAQFEELCDELGVPLAKEKMKGPASTLMFLGVELDSVQQCSRLPRDKLVKLRTLIMGILGSKKVTLKKLQVVTGHLNFACRVIAPGRAFIRRLCNAMKGLGLPSHHTRMSAAMRADLWVWLDFLEQYNGVSFWRDNRLLEADLQVQSHGAGGYGFGPYFRGKWC